MLDLGSTDFYFAVPSLPRDELEAFSSKLFDTWEAQIANELPLDDYSLTLEIEEGSIKGSGKVTARLIAVGLFISNYGSIIQGLQTMRSHVTLAGDYLTERAHEFLGPEKPAPSVRKRSGTLGQIQRLFIKVQRREMTAEEAMVEADEILGAEVTTAPDFMLRLSEALKEAPVQAQQLFLSPAGDLSEPAEEESTKRPGSRSSNSVPVIPQMNQFRVEIWRESKRGKKQIRIIAI